MPELDARNRPFGHRPGVATTPGDGRAGMESPLANELMGPGILYGHVLPRLGRGN
ncbi:hypothetical protein [Streptomyces sp. NPDC003480]